MCPPQSESESLQKKLFVSSKSIVVESMPTKSLHKKVPQRTKKLMIHNMLAFVEYFEYMFMTNSYFFEDFLFLMEGKLLQEITFLLKAH